MRRGFVSFGLALTGACAESGVRITADSVVTVSGLTDTTQVRVSVAGSAIPIVGRYEIGDGRVTFRPTFPFDRGRDYEVVVTREPATRLVHRFTLPAPTIVSSTRVTAVHPSSDTLPENQLRLYVEFSAPMSREGGLPFVKLLDDRGSEVTNAFLPLDADFWNHERTRYTLFLDPGRVKRDILPNRQMGRALVAGRHYSIVVDSSWRDGRGQPLVRRHVKRFIAGPADYRPIRLAQWRLDVPAAGGRQPVVIHFDRPLDHGLLNRAIGVETAINTAVDGVIEIPPGERSLRFVPAADWKVGQYHVIVLDILEDGAGNRVNRAFEIDNFERADSTAAPAKYPIPFRIR